MPKIIICIDMDAFFASVEQKTNPRLRGKPVAVIGSGTRTVITTASYEARPYGVKTGMTVYEAKKLCPHIIFVVGDNERYTDTCRRLEEIYKRFTPQVEIYSIDEAFLDVTGSHHLFGGPEKICTDLKTIIRQQFGINCTIGIGPNILIAKLASDISKPDGFRWVKEDEVGDLLEGMPVEELWGIGPGIKKRLASLGIRTCGELGRAHLEVLRRNFGIIGVTLKAMGKGIYERPVIGHEDEPKSIGHSMTLPKDIYKREEIESYILQLSEMVGKRARRYGYAGKVISLTIRYKNFETYTKQKAIPFYTNDTHEIYHYALAILDSIKLKDSIRLLGVRLSNILKESGQMTLLDDMEKRKSLLKAMDVVCDRYGDHALVWASYLRRLERPKVISPAWRPSGIKDIHIK
ncbi:MAG TPA: DNA polymerase IV [Syntrophorhabdaceae bacterium]|nr:DNA polymerase IV [Syntrophorhabdaceae bacterium]